jgi:hypothetical protein
VSQRNRTVSAPELMGLTVRSASRLYLSLPFILSDELEFASCADSISSVGTEVWDERPERKSGPLWTRRPLKLARETLLPHLANGLNPDQGQSHARPHPATALLWHLSPAALQLLRADSNNARWEVVAGKGAEPIPIKLEAAHLSLYRARSAVLTFEVSVLVTEATSWFAALNALRNAGRSDVVLTITPDGKRERGQGPLLPSGTTPTSTEIRELVGRLLDLSIHPRLPRPRASDGNQPEARWWSEIYLPGQLVPFPCLFVDGVGGDRDRVLQLAHRIRFGFGPQQAIDAGRPLLDRSPAEVWDYERGALFIAAVDGAGFLACDAPDHEFWRSTLPNHLREQYHVGFTIALAQRAALMNMSRLVAREWPAEGDHSRSSDHVEQRWVFARLLAYLQEYTARLEFDQAFHTEHHQNAYDRWRRALAVASLYREVHDEVEAMQDFLSAESESESEHRQRRFEILIFLLTFIVLPAQLPLALFAARLGEWPGIRDWPAWAEELGTALYAVMLLGIGAYVFLASRRLGRFWKGRRTVGKSNQS